MIKTQAKKNPNRGADIVGIVGHDIDISGGIEDIDNDPVWDVTDGVND